MTIFSVLPKTSSVSRVMKKYFPKKKFPAFYEKSCSRSDKYFLSLRKEKVEEI